MCFVDKCEKAIADDAPAPIVRGLYEGVVLNTFRQNAWALILADGRHTGLGRLQRRMGTVLLRAASIGEGNLPSPWLAAELGWTRLTTIVDEEALVFHAALSLPTAPSLARRTHKAAKSLKDANPRRLTEGEKTPLPHTYWQTAERLREAAGGKAIRDAFPDRVVVSQDQQREVLHAYRKIVRRCLLHRELAWWKKAMERLEKELDIPYARTKPLPGAFESTVADPSRWNSRLQQGAIVLAQLRAGAAFLRTGTRGEGRIHRPDRRCVLCLRGRRTGNAMVIQEETVTHVLGECPELAPARTEYLEKRERRMGRPKVQPKPRRIAVWILRQGGDEPADILRAGANFAADFYRRRRDALRDLNLWNE